MNKTIFLSACILCTVAAHSQTRLIALKSHSGSAANYRTERFGNFGIVQLPETRLEKVRKLNDSTVVLSNRVWNEIVLDTVMYHPQFSVPGATEKKLRELYNNEVEFENFDQPQPPATPDTEEGPSNYPASSDEKPKKDINRSPQQEMQAPLPAKRSKDAGNRRRTAMLLLLIIGGGTFLGTGMIASARRRRKATATYA